MPPAHFCDSGIRFTVLLEPARPANPVGSPVPADSPSTQAVLQALVAGEHPIDWITDQTGLSAANARRILRRLRRDGRIIQSGGRGRPTTYLRPK